MSSSWAEEAEFTAFLNAIKAPSGSKIKKVAEMAFQQSRVRLTHPPHPIPSSPPPSPQPSPPRHPLTPP